MSSSPLHKAPTILACIPLILGILVARRFALPYALIIFLISGALLLIIQFFNIKRRSPTNEAFLIIITVTFFSLGVLRFQHINKSIAFDQSIKSTFVATLLETPLEKANSYGVEILIDSAYTDSSEFLINTKAIAYLEKTPLIKDLQPGKRIRFQSYLNPPTERLNPEDFDYKAYLKRYRIFATCYIKKDDWKMATGELKSLRIRAAKVQQHVVSIFKSYDYDKEELALISALTVGYRDLIEEEQRNAYTASGATHVLAVSGLHVGIIYLFILWGFRFLGKSRKTVIIRVAVTILILWCFAFITGLSPSVTRASLMFTLVSLGSGSKQKSNIYNTIFLSAFILLFLNPNLLFDIGFQLSYAAVLSIVSFQPYLSTLFFNKWHIPKFLSDLMSVSIAAQIGTAPISIHIFNCFPSYFLLTNIWIIPLVGFILNYAIILILLSLSGLPVIYYLAQPLHWLLKTMNFGVNLISRLPHALSEFLYIDSVTMCFIYLAIIMLVLALNYHSKQYLFMTFTSIIIAISLNIYQQEQQKHIHKLFVFYDQNSFNIAAQQGLKSDLLIEDKAFRQPAYFIHHYLTKKNQTQSIIDKTDEHHNLRIYKDFIITPTHLHAIYSHELDTHTDSINITTLMLNKTEPKSIYNTYKQIKFNTLLIFQRPQRSIGYYQRFCDKNNIDLHLVYKDGAYVAELQKPLRQ